MARTTKGICAAYLRSGTVGVVLSVPGALSDALARVASPAARPGHSRRGVALLVGTGLSVLPLLVLVAGATLLLGTADQAVMTTALIYVVAVVGIGMFSGNSGVLSLGHVAFMAIGAYVVGWLTIPSGLKATQVPALPGLLADAELGFWPALGIAALVALVVAALVGPVIASLRNASAVIVSFALLVIVDVVFDGATSLTGGQASLYGFAIAVGPWTALLVAAIAILVARAWRDSQRGLQLRATREDDLAARAMGIDVTRRRWQAWALSAAPMGAAGGLYALFLAAITPDQFYLTLTFSLVAMLIVGGRTTVFGGVVGAVVITIISHLLSNVENQPDFLGLGLPQLFGVSQVVVALLMLVGLVYRPAGVVGRLEPDEWLAARLRRRRSVAADDELAAPAYVAADGQERSPAAGTVLVISGLTKAYGGVTAVSDVSFEIGGGEIVGLIGPNGSGKTTTMNLISGLTPPTGGRIELAGRDITSWAPHEVSRAGIARTFQNIRLFGSLSVLQNVEIGLSTRPGRQRHVSERAQALLEDFGIGQLAHRSAGTLAYGLQRRVEIVRALAAEPALLLLDEPAAGLNAAETEELGAAIAAVQRKYGIAVLIIDHSMPMIMGLCHRVVAMAEGAVLANAAPDVVQRDPRVIAAYLGAAETREEPSSA
jgi:branched-chain amino acid transport system permease protein